MRKGFSHILTLSYVALYCAHIFTMKSEPLLNETELIRECQRGNRNAFGAVYDHYIRRIYNFIFYKTLHKETAEDLTSETFMKALDKISQFDLSRSFSAWLYAIAGNAVIDHFRRTRHHTDIDDIWDLSDETDISGDLDTKENLRELKKHLKMLPANDRNVLFMRIWLDMPYKEIAVALDKTEAAVKMAVSRSTSKLRTMMTLSLYMFLLTHL